MQEKQNKSGLHFVAWEVTQACNLNCLHCRGSATSDRKADELSTQEAKDFLDSIISFSQPVIILSGGEPLMREDIIDILSSAHEEELMIGLLTNGTMHQKDPNTREKVINAIREYVNWVAISIDGTPIEDEQIRHPVVRERIDRIKELCYGIKDINNLSATVTLQKTNIPINLKEPFSVNTPL